MKKSLNEFDVFYISYDEPKKEEFWADLLNKIPWAKRVDGVKGFDNAHKACAMASETSHFITVDGDNIIDESLFDQEINITEDNKNSVFSWAGKNIVNGLVYGNGGIKLWQRDFVLNMQTHENSKDPVHQVDFCWYTNYIQMNNIYSTVHVNQSEYHAFRAGFREGVKMTLLSGIKPEKNILLSNQIFWKNYNRLLIWCSVGSDVEHGLWAIYGARLGLYMLMCSDWNFAQIRDYDWMNYFFQNNIKSKIKTSTDLINELADLEDKLKKELHVHVVLYDENQSKFFKSVYTNPPRVSVMTTERELQ